MATLGAPTADRIKGAVLALAIQALIGWGLIVGLGVSIPDRIDDTLKLFALAPDRPPPPVEKIVPPPRPSKRPEGTASPPNLRQTPTEIVAPKPLVIPPPTPPPVIAAPIAGPGAAPSAGAADTRGPGFGAGGFGNGRGGGGRGDGDGGGLRDETPPRQIGGSLRGGEIFRAADEGGGGGTVGVRYVVWTDGRVTDCEVTRSSGNRLLDDTTCRLIIKRFRYRPALDDRGRPVASTIIENHTLDVAIDPGR